MGFPLKWRVKLDVCVWGRVFQPISKDSTSEFFLRNWINLGTTLQDTIDDAQINRVIRYSKYDLKNKILE